MTSEKNDIRSTITIVIATFNSVADIGACLAGIRGSVGDVEIKTVIVDNASTDETVNSITCEITSRPADIQLLKNDRNLYYAVACNQGAEAANGDFLLLLNPDVQLAATSIEEMIKYLEANPRVAAVAPRLVYPNGRIQQSVRRFPTYATLWAELIGLSRIFRGNPRFDRWRVNLDLVDTPVEVDQPMASCLLIRRETWDALGGFDESFPMFFNDVDFCYRLRKAGGMIVYLPQTVCAHRSGGSVRPAMGRMVWFSHLGFLRYLRKHYYLPLDQLWYLLAWPPTIIAAAIRSLYWTLRNVKR